MKSVLCLDFDGVIVDSIDECFLTAYNSYFVFTGRQENVITEINKTDNIVYKEFLKNRYLVRPAREYYVLMKLLFNYPGKISLKRFSEEVTMSSELLSDFEKIFFSTRKEFIQSNKEKWLSLHRLYSEFSDTWEQVKKIYKVFIVTNKNVEAVNTLFEHFKIKIAKKNIYGYEKVKSKNETVKHIASLLNIPLNKVLFVDDSPQTIKELTEKGIRAYLAEWGYFSQKKLKHNSIKHMGELLK